MSTTGDEIDGGNRSPRVEVLLEEASALAMYVARRGAGLEANKNAYEDLVEAIAKAEGQGAEARDFWSLQVAYSRLSALTYGAQGVSGRTVLDTVDPGFRLRAKRTRPLWLGFVLFGLALVLEAGVFGRFVDEPVLRLMMSAVWGGLGACVFLAKRISDRLAEMAYEDARMRGDGIRVFLGAMLGVVVVGLFFSGSGRTEAASMEELGNLRQEFQSVREEVAALPGRAVLGTDGPADTDTDTPTEGTEPPEGGGSPETDGPLGREGTPEGNEPPKGGGPSVPFGVAPATLAFLAGLGVKPVYAAFESLSEALASRFKPSGK